MSLKDTFLPRYAIINYTKKGSVSDYILEVVHIVAHEIVDSGTVLHFRVVSCRLCFEWCFSDQNAPKITATTGFVTNAILGVVHNVYFS